MPGIDLHTHLAPLLELTTSPITGVARDDDGRLIVDGQPIGPLRLYRPSELAAHLDRLSLSEAAISVPPPFFRQGLLAADAGAWARAVNDGLRRAVVDEPRFLPLAYLPIEHADAAASEYQRIRSDSGWAGVVATAGGRSISLADPTLDPLWRLLDADACLLLLHPGASSDARLEEFYLANLLGNPVETAVAAAQLVFGGVPASHPRMRVLLVHCGGCVPAILGRWEHGLKTQRPGVDLTIEPPREAVRRFYVDCLAHDPSMVDRAVEVFGEEHMVLGSDWPFPMGADDPALLVVHRGDAFAERVGVGNAYAALGRRAASTDR